MRLQWKLFFVILLSSSFLVLGMYLATQWTVDKGLLNYVNIREQNTNQKVVERLGQAYQRYGSWDFIEQDPRLFDRLVRNAERDQKQRKGDAWRLPPPPRHPPPRREEDFRRDDKPPPPPGRLPRLALVDALKNPVIGPPLSGKETLLPISVEGGSLPVGWIAFRPPKHLSDDFDLALSEELEAGFIWVGLLMLVLSAALAWPLSILLVRRIKNIAHATKQMAEGELSFRLKTDTSDELGELARDFNHLAQTLGDNDAARKRWIADISHELRTPLAVTGGEIEAMMDGVRPASKENLESAHQEITHLKRLIDDLYQLTNADIGALQYRKEEISVNGLLEREANSFLARLDQAEINFEWDLPANDYSLWADADRLKQVIQNILQNSLKYTDKPGEIRLTMYKEYDELIVRIDDSSPGVPADQLDKLFDPLYRVDVSRNKRTGGSGLGLAICRQIVRGHNGTIGAFSSQLGGVRIEIRLPIN